MRGINEQGNADERRPLHKTPVHSSTSATVPNAFLKALPQKQICYDIQRNGRCAKEKPVKSK